MKILSVIIFFSLSLSQHSYDGKFFDSGRTMSDVSKNAPKGLDALLPMLGAWTVTETAFRNDSAIASYTGHSEIILNNRGNSYMERTYMYKTMQGNSNEYTMVLFTKAKFTGAWGKGVVSDYKENVTVYDGDFEGNTLILQNALRVGGGQKVQMEKLSYSIDKNEFSFVTEISSDYGKTWTKKARRMYTKVQKAHTMFTTRNDYGKPNPDRVPEAAQFDFLLGEANAAHSMMLPTGKKVNFPATTTAIHTLGGKAIMEFATVDVDPSLPDAATTIIRIYNRAMRRWDNLYLNNRSNSLFYFGGVKENDKIILTNFEDHRGLSAMNRFVFYDVKDNSDYLWYGDVSYDGGKNFIRFWEITVTKK